MKSVNLINIGVIFCVLLKCVICDKNLYTDQNLAFLDSKTDAFPNMLTKMLNLKYKDREITGAQWTKREGKESNSRYSYYDEPLSYYQEGSYRPSHYWSYTPDLHSLYEEREPIRHIHNVNQFPLRDHREDFSFDNDETRGGPPRPKRDPPPNRGPPKNRGPPSNRGPPANRGPPSNRGPPPNRGPPSNRGPPPNKGPPHNREPSPTNNEDFNYESPVESNENDHRQMTNHDNIYYNQNKVTSTSPLPNYGYVNKGNDNSGKPQNSAPDRFLFQAQPVVPEQ